MTVRDILKRINYTVIIDGKEYHNRDITFGAWNERIDRMEHIFLTIRNFEGGLHNVTI